MGHLRFPAFLLVLSYITVAQIRAEVINMGMFPDGPDYSFYNCRDKMLEMVTKTGGLLETELNKTKEFKSLWENSKECEKKIPGGAEEHRIALESFAADDEFRKTFNKALRESRGDEFPFKSLFFLMADAAKLLKNNCGKVYSGTKKEYNATIGEKVRFNRFFPANLEYSDVTEKAQNDEENLFGTVFNIQSCYTIKLDDHVCDAGEDIDLLISPTEVFTVQNIRIVNNSNNNYKEITLMHSELRSSSNCSALKSTPKPEEPKESSCLLSSSLWNLMACLLIVCFCSLTH